MKKRILFVHHVGCRGGAGTMLANIIKGLDLQAFEPIVVCPPGDIISQLEEAGARVIIASRPIWQFSHVSGFWRPIWHPRVIQSFLMIRKDRQFWADFFRKTGADIVHLNAVTLAPMAWSAKAAGIRVVCGVQETFVHGWFGVRTRWLLKLLSTQMDAVTFISEYDRRLAACTAPIVEVIPNWVDLRTMNPHVVSCQQARASLGLSLSNRVVLFMGGISPLKGTLTLLMAIAQTKGMDELVVLIAGYNERLTPKGWLSAIVQKVRCMLGRDYFQQVQRSLLEERVHGRVRFVGMRNDVASLYAASDVVVFPSSAPHQARPVLEAGAFGKPVIVSDFPETREYVEDGVNGLLVKPNDPGTLAEAISQVLFDTEMAVRLGAANYERTVSKHDASFNTRAVADVYRRVLRLGKGGLSHE